MGSHPFKLNACVFFYKVSDLVDHLSDPGIVGDEGLQGKGAVLLLDGDLDELLGLEVVNTDGDPLTERV